MDTAHYLEKFQYAANRVDKSLLAANKLEAAFGLYQQDSAFLKLYKKSWASGGQDPLIAETRIFFSIWTNDTALKQHKLMYNIHAFKLRKLPGYTIESRKFAEIFRQLFKQFAHQWPNVSTNYGPLTLMQGWVKTGSNPLENEILNLSSNFFEIADLIEAALIPFKR